MRAGGGRPQDVPLIPSRPEGPYGARDGNGSIRNGQAPAPPPTPSFRPEPCGARRSGETLRPRARGFSTPLRSGRNDGVGGPKTFPSSGVGPKGRIEGRVTGTVRSGTDRLQPRPQPRHFDRSRAEHGGVEKPCAHGHEISPLRCAPVEMAGWGWAGASFDTPPSGATQDEDIFPPSSRVGPEGRIEGRVTGTVQSGTDRRSRRRATRRPPSSRRRPSAPRAWAATSAAIAA